VDAVIADLLATLAAALGFFALCIAAAWIVQKLARLLSFCPDCGRRLRFKDESKNGMYVCTMRCPACGNTRFFVGE
jgi:predicted RNA-binding Zn-ribbon protein involved in translation (DUF1610 family)